MKESDWKIFGKLKDKATERFCEIALKESQEVISNAEIHVHNRFILLNKLLNNRDKQLSLMFDGHCRSKAWLQLLAIRSEGLADEDLLAKLSVEFLEETDPQKRRM